MQSCSFALNKAANQSHKKCIARASMSKARSLQQQHLNLKKKSAFKWKSLLPHKQGERGSHRSRLLSLDSVSAYAPPDPNNDADRTAPKATRPAAVWLPRVEEFREFCVSVRRERLSRLSAAAAFRESIRPLVVTFGGVPSPLGVCGAAPEGFLVCEILRSFLTLVAVGRDHGVWAVRI
ncbi:AAEL000920-PA [Aedes aegypti]|uniref:AAEL000920-PA n=1 Tax=Aedes aegypti TaxID=7159 RepID=Q17MW6_AEDAE|nr:AAEL000920-PA [Aedes aegypti]